MRENIEVPINYYGFYPPTSLIIRPKTTHQQATVEIKYVACGKNLVRQVERDFKFHTADCSILEALETMNKEWKEIHPGECEYINI